MRTATIREVVSGQVPAPIKCYARWQDLPTRPPSCRCFRVDFLGIQDDDGDPRFSRWYWAADAKQAEDSARHYFDDAEVVSVEEEQVFA